MLVRKLGQNAKLDTAKNDTVDRIIEPPVKVKSAKIREQYNELRALVHELRSYFPCLQRRRRLPLRNVAAAKRSQSYGEEATFNFASNYNVYYPKEESFFSHNEREFIQLPLNQIAANSIASLPAVVSGPDRVKLVVAESDVDDYPGLWLHGNSNNSLTAMFPPVPLKETVPDQKHDRDIRVTEAADYIAATKGTRTFPWRIIGVAAK